MYSLPNAPSDPLILQGRGKQDDLQSLVKKDIGITRQNSLPQQQNKQSIHTQKQSRFSRFFWKLGCCNNDQLDECSNHKNSSIGGGQNSLLGDKLTLNNQESKTSYCGSYMENCIQNRNVSKSSLQLFNVLYYRPSEYSILLLDKAGIIKIPVLFRRYFSTPKQSFAEMFGNLFVENCYTLVFQEFLDYEFVKDISSSASHVLCAYHSRAISLNQTYTSADDDQMQESQTKKANHNQVNQNTSGTSLNSQMLNQSLESISRMNEVNKTNVDWVQCGDLKQISQRADRFDKVIIIPTSLKHQGNAFDGNFSMRKEFRRTFVEVIENCLDFIDKVTFILPKYIKIKEVMHLFFEAFMNKEKSMNFLNLGMQFHSVTDQIGEVEAIAIDFQREKHLEILYSLANGIFSKIYSRDVQPQLKDEQNTNQPHVNDGGCGEQFYLEVSSCSLKSLYGFMKELNSCLIINYENMFLYRTQVLDYLLQYGVVSNSFIENLLDDITKQDESQQITVPQQKEKKQKKKLTLESFKQYFKNNSKLFDANELNNCTQESSKYLPYPSSLPLNLSPPSVHATKGEIFSFSNDNLEYIQSPRTNVTKKKNEQIKYHFHSKLNKQDEYTSKIMISPTVLPRDLLIKESVFKQQLTSPSTKYIKKTSSPLNTEDDHHSNKPQRETNQSYD